MRKNLFTSLLLVVLVSACGDNPAAPVDGRAADAQAADETYITWEELLVDDPGLSKIPIRGAGRMADRSSYSAGAWGHLAVVV